MKIKPHLRVLPAIMVVGPVVLLAGCNSDNDTTTVNSAPIAIADAADTMVGSTIVIDVLANDSDPDGDALVLTSYTIVAGKGNASISNNQLQFEPTTAGNTIINYVITDPHGKSASSEVTIDVIEDAAPTNAYVGSQTC